MEPLAATYQQKKFYLELKRKGGDLTKGESDWNLSWSREEASRRIQNLVKLTGMGDDTTEAQAALIKRLQLELREQGVEVQNEVPSHKDDASKLIRELTDRKYELMDEMDPIPSDCEHATLLIGMAPYWKNMDARERYIARGVIKYVVRFGKVSEKQEAFINKIITKYVKPTLEDMEAAKRVADKVKRVIELEEGAVPFDPD